MHIGGFQKNSLIDFPETIACIIFTQGCNFICPYCHNPDLVVSPQKRADNLFDEAKILDFLDQRKDLMEGVVITGGEPTLQKDLTAFCSKIKQMGYRVKLDTNGTRPKILEYLLDHQLIDFVSMDIKTIPDHYHGVVSEKFDTRKIETSIGLLISSPVEYEFRTTCTKPFITEEIMDEIGKLIKGARSYILQKCSRNIKALDLEFLKADHHFFSDEKMEQLKHIISPYVKAVVVR